MLMTKEKVTYKEQITLSSYFLQRNVIVDFYMPYVIIESDKLPLLFINDGQDLPKFTFEEMLEELVATETIEPMAIVAIHCGEDRKNEYGTAHITDFEGRGAKAEAYTNFIFEELLPFTRKKYNLPSVKEKSFAGFSLGALSALDIVWNKANQFDKVGCFSGSFWWRSKNVDESYSEDLDRIMHQQIRAGNYAPWLQFFFQCGTLDELEDRNNNGVIDAIDDTKELIDELVKKGYNSIEDIYYYEVEGGKHDVPTWGNAMPTFLKWGWGINKDDEAC
jgi:enterochelin esterase-like enzyme